MKNPVNSVRARKTIREAAKEIDLLAGEIRACCTINNRYPPEHQSDKRFVARLRVLARDLKAIARP